MLLYFSTNASSNLNVYSILAVQVSRISLFWNRNNESFEIGAKKRAAIQAAARLLAGNLYCQNDCSAQELGDIWCRTQLLLLAFARSSPLPTPQSRAMQCKKTVLPAIAVLLMGYTLYCLYASCGGCDCSNRFPVPSVEQLSSRRNSGISVWFLASLSPQVFWNAPFLSGGGYCSEAISLVRALDKRGFDVHIQQVGMCTVCDA